MEWEPTLLGFRADRYRSGNGRTYCINFTASDEKGGEASGMVFVFVPRGLSGVEQCLTYCQQLFEAKRIGTGLFQFMLRSAYTLYSHSSLKWPDDFPRPG